MSFWKTVGGYLRWRDKRTYEVELQKMALGITSETDGENDEHIVMLDFDTKDIVKVTRSVEEVQEFWNLSDAFVYDTKNGFHVLFYFDQVPYERCRMIIDYARGVDPMFKYISRMYHHKTLRVRGKHGKQDIRYHMMIKGKRVPSKKEVDIGELKRTEHLSMLRSEKGE